MTTLGPSGTQFRAPGTKAVVARLPVGTGAGAARWALAALRCLYSSSTSRQKLELGGATIIGNIIYFATLQDTATTGLDIRTGRRVFHFPDGKFDPAVSDGKRLYIDGYRDLYALDPLRPVAAPTQP